MKDKKVAFLLSSFSIGGIEKNFLQLTKCFFYQGYQVDIAVINGQGELRDQLSSQVTVFDFRKKRSLASILELVRYLIRNTPEVLISAQTHNNFIAILAALLTGNKTKIIVTEHTDFRALKTSPSLKERLRPAIAALFYPFSEKIIAVSKGVANSMSLLTRIDLNDIDVIYNPIPIEKLQKMAKTTPAHPWLGKDMPPVILAVGRLVKEKNFSMLIDAFFQVRKGLDAKLIILGEGYLRQQLEEQILELDLSKEVSLPGYAENPYSYMAAADLFVLSSNTEGFGVVLVEALTCGASVISTDCFSGPAEILMGGKYGALTPVGNSDQMAKTIIERLAKKDTPNDLSEYLKIFSDKTICAQYLSMVSSIVN